MNKNEWNEGLNHLDPDIVDAYVLQKDKLRSKKKAQGIWLRFGALAACSALIVSAAMAALTRNTDTGIAPWTPIIGENIPEVLLTAEEVGAAFDVKYDSIGTNRYAKIYTASLDELYLQPLPSTTYLPIYSIENVTTTKSNLQDFIDKYLGAASAFFDIHAPSYEIEQDESWYRKGSVIYEAQMREENKVLRFVAEGNSLFFHNIDFNKRMLLNGNMVSVLSTDTDEQIKEKLQDTIIYICNSFGKEYDSVQIQREYSDQQLKSITVYLCTPERTIFPEKFPTDPRGSAPVASSYIALFFHTDWGGGTAFDWGGSKEEAYLSSFFLHELAEPWNEQTVVMSKARMLTLDEAEALLQKGYVFGRHICPLCMEQQSEICFEDYTGVTIEYITDKNGEKCIPFYAFYKYTGQTTAGMQTYARTYVPAVEVSGLDAYFEQQTNQHSGNRTDP